MSVTWDDGAEPPRTPIGPAGWLRVVLRGLVVGVVIFGGFAVLLVLRLIERPLFGQSRPLTPWITRAACRLALILMRLRLKVSGTPMRDHGALVSNHSSWLDIFVLNASDRIYFVSKAEVSRWPGIGWLARGTGTVFIERDRKQARQHTEIFEDRLHLGHKLLFFPEGTSTDGQQVLPFKTTLFAAFRHAALQDRLRLQPVSVIYRAPRGEDARFYGWWGDMGFGPHLVKTLSAARAGSVEVIYHPALKPGDFPDRKSLALACETAVRHGHSEALAIAQKGG